MDIRLAYMRELPELVEILQKVIPLMHQEGNFQWDDDYPTLAILANDIKERHLFVALTDRKIVGFVVVNALFPSEYVGVPWTTSPNAYTFHRLMLHPLYRGKGIAKSLFRFVEHRGRAMGLRAIRVDTNENNKSMVALFAKFSYAFVGKVTFREVKSDFLCYEKIL